MRALLSFGCLLAAAGCVEEARSSNVHGEDEAHSNRPPSEAWTTVGERLPWDFATLLPQAPPLKIGDGAVPVRAESCGSCHVDHYNEWKGSTHAHAMRDPQYFAELSKQGSPRWLCLNCHAPVQNQRRMIIDADTRLRADPNDVSGLQTRPNPDFDPIMQREGVTCATCHVRVEDGASVVIASEKSNRAPHPVRAGRQALHDVCQRCHDPGPGRITPTFTCWFETAREGRAHGVEQSCVDCHMPATERPLVPGGPPRASRHHFWTGGGVPKTFDDYEHLLARGYEPGVDLHTELRGGQLVARLVNRRAGHHVTSADPERHLLLRVRALVGGRHRTLGVRRIGQSWDWGSLDPVRPARRTSDNRIQAGGASSWSFELPDNWSALTVDVAHVRLSPSNAGFMKSTELLPSLVKIWPEAQAVVADIEQHYPFMTWFARQRLSREGRVREVPLRALIQESRALKGTSLADYEAMMESRSIHEEPAR